ncbi:hypothetical protein O181_009940 [Austropuccinia psidii MF-1]|uniref:Uncharacterized protein n=1 Tax=Austropuccinia psidii MF-1 TaxID=1389203 RepID=A0A9Q3BS82_9BASI|nr:hypothetical protein [Austropuccinia psidii MF-1]
MNAQDMNKLIKTTEITEEILQLFPSSIPIITEEPSNDCIHEENPSSIELISIDNEDDNIYVNELEHKPQRIRVIVPRHTTLLSSEINSNNILPLLQRQPRANLTSLISHTPNNSSEAIISPNKENWNLSLQKELLKINKLNLWTL